MDVKTYTKHERTHRTVLTEVEIHDILVEAVAKKVGITPQKDIASKVFISNTNSGSLRSTEYKAEVEITEDLAAQPRAVAAG